MKFNLINLACILLFSVESGGFLLYKFLYELAHAIVMNCIFAYMLINW